MVFLYDLRNEEEMQKILFPKKFEYFLQTTIPDLAFFMFEKVTISQEDFVSRGGGKTKDSGKRTDGGNVRFDEMFKIQLSTTGIWYFFPSERGSSGLESAGTHIS